MEYGPLKKRNVIDLMKSKIKFIKKCVFSEIKSEEHFLKILSEEEWEQTRANEKKRLSICQDLVDFFSKDLNLRRCYKVQFVQGMDKESGVFNPDKEIVYLNEDLFLHDVNVFNDNLECGITYYGTSVLAYIVIAHEMMHAYQWAIINKRISRFNTDDRMEIQLLKNNMKSEPIKIGELSASRYIKNISCNDIVTCYLYYLQISERQAYAYSENKSRKFIEKMKSYGVSEAYLQNAKYFLDQTSIFSILEKAQHCFQCDDIIQNIDYAMMNLGSGTDYPVDENVLKCVSNSMIASFE